MIYAVMVIAGVIIVLLIIVIDLRLRGMSGVPEPHRLRLFFEEVGKMPFEDARTKAVALLSDPEIFTKRPIDTSALASVRNRVPAALFEVWSRHGAIQDGPAVIRPDRIEPFPDWLQEQQLSEFRGQTELVSLGDIDEGVLIVISPRTEAVWEVDSEGEYPALVTTYPSFYHWILSRDPNLFE